jgi:hypothetical protein
MRYYGFCLLTFNQRRCGSTLYTYLWSNGQTDATISGLAAGTYTVTVTDANLCTDTESVTITQPAAAVLAAINDSTNVLCYAGLTGSATASASGGVAPYTYLWSNGQTDATISGLAAGTYTVTVTDANLCTDTESVTITQPAAAVLAAINDSTNVLCYGGLTGSATASASGGVAPYTYLWSNGQTDATISGLAAGTYTVTVTDANLCTDTESVTITQPAAAVLAAINDSTNVLCYGGLTGSATASASGGVAPYTYLWSNGQTDATISGLAAGTYTVTVTDANLCTDTESVTITQPAAAVLTAINDSTNVLCYGGLTGSATASASGGVAPYTYLWSNGQTDATISGLAAGTYTVTVTDANLCTDTESVTITQPAAAVLAAINDSTNVLCYGGLTGSATASASGGVAPYTYLWSNGQTDATISGLAAGTYTVTVTDANLCTDTESVTITQPAAAVLAAINDSTNVLCYGGLTGSATASASGGVAPYTYLWSNGQTDATISGLAAGTYTVTVTDANLCTDTESVTITQPAAAVLTAINDSTNVLCYGGLTGSATASASGGVAPYTYLWSNGQTDATISGLAAGTYTVTVTDANLCTDTESVTITHTRCRCSTTAILMERLQPTYFATAD